MNPDMTIEAGLGAHPAAAQPAPAAKRRWWPWALLLVGLGLVLMLVLAAALASGLLSVLRPELDGLRVDAGQLGAHGEQLLRQLSEALTTLADALQQVWPWLAKLDWHGRFDDLTWGGLTLGVVVFSLCVVLAVLGLLTVLPVLVVAVLAGSVLSVLAALLLAAAVLALVLLPLWLPVLALVWWGLRRLRTGPRPSAAAIPNTASANPATTP